MHAEFTLSVNKDEYAMYLQMAEGGRRLRAFDREWTVSRCNARNAPHRGWVYEVMFVEIVKAEAS